MMQNNNLPKVLIVDDEKGIRTGTERLLENENYRVVTAENGTEGVQKGTAEDFDLAIIDLKMPDMDGLEVLAEIKKARPNTVCFIATAYASYETAIESTRLGAYSYIPKPFTPEELLHNLQKGYNQRLLLLESERLKKEREEKLLEIANERSRLSTIIKLIDDGVLVVNKLGELVYFNSASITNLNLKEIEIGEYVLDKLPQEVSELVSKHIKSDNKIHKSYSKQIELVPKEFFVEAKTSPVPNPDGGLAGVVIVIRNITELKKIELIKSQFVSMVAHELKTPIVAVQGFLKIINDKNLNVPEKQQSEYIDRSIVRLKSLLDLVNDLLDISRMELKTKQREIEELDIKEVMESTIQFLEIELKKKEIDINLNYEDEVPRLKADRSEITRVFTNILSNAIKYNKEKGKIDTSIYKADHFLVIKISDTGIGLKPEEKERLFHEFYRAKNEKTRGISGTGLGLTIVKQIIDAYHGKIDVESKFGEGSTFTIYLPINKTN